MITLLDNFGPDFQDKSDVSFEIWPYSNLHPRIKGIWIESITDVRMVFSVYDDAYFTLSVFYGALEN